MKVITPTQVANATGSKYLGVLVAAKYARKLNEFRRAENATVTDYDPSEAAREKLTTTSLGVLAAGGTDYRLVERRRPEG